MQYLNGELSNSQLNKLKSGIKKWFSSYLSSNIIGDDETNFSHKLLSTNTQVSKISNAPTANIKFSKNQLLR